MKRVLSDHNLLSEDIRPLKHRTRPSWLNLGTEFGLDRNVRRMIYSKLTSLERVIVEVAHGVKKIVPCTADSKCDSCRIDFKYRCRDVRWSRIAGKGGFIPVIDWMKGEGLLKVGHCVLSLLENRRLDALEWLYKTSCDAMMKIYPHDIIFAATISRSVELLRWIYPRLIGTDGDEYARHWIFRHALSVGIFNVIEWLLLSIENPLEWMENILRDKDGDGNTIGRQLVGNLAYEGRLDVIQWLDSRNLIRPKWLMDMLDNALDNDKNRDGHSIKVLNWLVMTKKFDISGLRVKAFGFYSIEILIFIKNNAVIVWSSTFIHDAIVEDAFDVLKWSVKNGCPFPKDEKYCVVAAEHNLLECLKWLYCQGKQPLSKEVFVQAKMHPDGIILDWLNSLDLK